MSSSAPQNQNQKMALEYRERKLAVLEEALLSVTQHIQLALKFNSFHKLDADNVMKEGQESKNKILIETKYGNEPSTSRQAGLLSLEVAYDWLKAHYPDTHTSVMEIIAKDQDEPLPLNWAILVGDWDHAYWVVWIYLIWIIWARDGSDFITRHPNLSTWVNLMKT
jgi:histone-lysine N-methyltransferase SETD3